MDIQQIKVNELPLAATLTGLEVLGFNASTNEAVRAAISLLEGLDGKPIELQKTTTHIQWRIQGGAWSNLIALSDIKGDKGDKGDVGTPNSLSIGTVTSGSTPSATISGLSPSQTLNLTLPKGDIGPKGDKGDTGAKGEKGDTGAKGEKGDTGAKGEKGDTGPSNTLSIGTVTGGIDASASITGIAPNQTLNLTLPKGDKGDKGDPFEFNDLTPEQKAELKGEKGDKGDPFEFNDLTPEQKAELKGEKGDKGDAFEYSDFTPEQLAALKGDKGDAFEYSDFTSAQLEALKVKGDTGDKGWSPVYSEVADGTRIVRKLVDYIGGEGTKPTNNINMYLKSDGTFTAVIAEAMNVRITGGTLPSGGTTGQVLKKKSSTDFDTEWGAVSGGGGEIVADFVLNSSREIAITALDASGLFTCPNHGLVNNNYVWLVANSNVNDYFPNKYLWNEYNASTMEYHSVTVIDQNNIRLSRVNSCTFPQTFDITKWHIELGQHFNITGLSGYLFEIEIIGKISTAAYLFVTTNPSSTQYGLIKHGTNMSIKHLFAFSGLLNTDVYLKWHGLLDGRAGLSLSRKTSGFQTKAGVFDKGSFTSLNDEVISINLDNGMSPVLITGFSSDTGLGFSNGTRIIVKKLA